MVKKLLFKITFQICVNVIGLPQYSNLYFYSKSTHISKFHK